MVNSQTRTEMTLSQSFHQQEIGRKSNIVEVMVLMWKTFVTGMVMTAIIVVDMPSVGVHNYS